MNSSDKEGGWGVAQTHLNPSGEGMGCSSVCGCSGLLTYATPHPPRQTGGGEDGKRLVVSTFKAP